MLTLLWRALDVGWAAGLLALFPALVFIAQLPDTWSTQARWLGRLLAYGGAWCLCAVALVFIAIPPGRLVVLQRGEEIRLASVQETHGRNGGGCHVTTYRLDGTYIGNTGHRGECEGRSGSGTLLVETTPFFRARNHVLVDLWTAEDLAWRSSLVEGPHQLKGVDTSKITVLRPDGTEEAIPWPSGSGASSLRELSGGSETDHPSLLDVRLVSGTCAGSSLVRHRSVAFGDGTTYLSALVAPGGEPLWTTDMTAEWGERKLLGVVEHDGMCWAIGAARGFGLRIVSVP